VKRCLKYADGENKRQNKLDEYSEGNYRSSMTWSSRRLKRGCCPWPGANVDLGPVGEWAEQNGGGKKSRQNIKTSPLVFTFFLFAFRNTTKRQFGFA